MIWRMLVLNSRKYEEMKIIKNYCILPQKRRVPLIVEVSLMNGRHMSFTLLESGCMITGSSYNSHESPSHQCIGSDHRTKGRNPRCLKLKN